MTERPRERARQELDRVLTFIAANMDRVDEAWAIVVRSLSGPCPSFARDGLPDARRTPLGVLGRR